MSSPPPPGKSLRLDRSYISLTTHPGTSHIKPAPLEWGASDPETRGPVIGTMRHKGLRNVIGAHGGSYCVFRGLSVATGELDPLHTPDFTDTEPVRSIGPFPSWSGTDTFKSIATMDPYGHVAQVVFKGHLDKGYDVRPTIAVTKAHIDVPEILRATEEGRLKADGRVLLPSGQINIVKAAVEPVWHLPILAKRFGCSEAMLRKVLFEETGGMYPELVTRCDLKVFMPPIGGLTIYTFGDLEAITDPKRQLTVRVHDECNGSDVFGSDICTCRPYLIHGIEECVKQAQNGGAGVIVYFRKEGRALGEVTKYLVYNRRKRQEGGDSAAEYFNCTSHVAGVEDARFQSLMPDPLLWLGITQIDRLLSMSDMKYNAIVSAGINVVERVPIPPHLVPADAQVEITAKVAAGYNGGAVFNVTHQDLIETMGRAAYES